jgi:Smg protein
MFEILVYLFENYYHDEAAVDHDVLAEKLTAAGFENGDISDALDWLRGLGAPKEELYSEAFELCDGFRGWTGEELARLATEARGFLTFLESARVLTPPLRELIIDRAMALEDEVVELDKLKVIALMVLWARRGSVDTLILEELLPEGGPRHIH